MSVRLFYDRWPTYNRRLTDAVRNLAAGELAWQAAPGEWPLWATVAHVAGARVYWLCGVAGEPGAESTPFPDPLSGVGWEDDEGTPRSAGELVSALDSSFAVVERCLDTWTPPILAETVSRAYGDVRQVHSRASILQRIVSHDAYHAGELSQVLGAHGRPAIDLWRPG